MSDRTELNAHAYKYASYMNQIRRLVNFYWQQQLDNLNEPLQKQDYTTVVVVQLDSKGNLTSIKVTQSSGIKGVDDCVTDAFVLVGPILSHQNYWWRTTLSTFRILVLLSRFLDQKMNYGGIDPKAAFDSQES